MAVRNFEAPVYVHVAGPTVGSPERRIQRCLICGLKLVDTLNQAAPLNPDGSPPRDLFWQSGGLIEISPGNRTQFLLIGSLLDESTSLPPNLCWPLVE